MVRAECRAARRRPVMAGDLSRRAAEHRSHRRACASRWRAAVVDRAARRAIPRGRRRPRLRGVGRSDPRAQCRGRPRRLARPGGRQAHRSAARARRLGDRRRGGDLIAIRASDGTRGLAQARWPGRVPAVARRRSAVVSHRRRPDCSRSTSATGRERWTSASSARRPASRWSSAAASTSARRIAIFYSLRSSSGRVGITGESRRTCWGASR